MGAGSSIDISGSEWIDVPSSGGVTISLRARTKDERLAREEIAFFLLHYLCPTYVRSIDLRNHMATKYPATRSEKWTLIDSFVAFLSAQFAEHYTKRADDREVFLAAFSGWGEAIHCLGTDAVGEVERAEALLPVVWNAVRVASAVFGREAVIAHIKSSRYPVRYATFVGKILSEWEKVESYLSGSGRIWAL